MQIAPGQTSLSLAMLKALGSQTAAPAAAASPKSAVEQRPSQPGPSAPGEGMAASRHLPRGSFVDLRA